MNFHKLVEGSAQVKGPFKTRKKLKDCWREVSEENRQSRRGALLDRGRAEPRHCLTGLSPVREASKERAAPSGFPGGAACLFGCISCALYKSIGMIKPLRKVR